MDSTLNNQDCVRAQCISCPRFFSYLIWRYRQWQWLSRVPLVWCFRNKEQQWQPFEMKNQAILWQSLNEPRHPYCSHECHIRDRAIASGREVVRVVVQEHVAFSMHPDWSEPIVYEVQLCHAPPRRHRFFHKLWKWRNHGNGAKIKDETLLAAQSHSSEK
ncbi:hypothetical protein K492DRAFT_176620 [Lichtheimia hyalospora FSU 10163]|nr:hypothetical protein K492DRAFT_176620 [Lichtheimia hyalospora FSU 10163]